MIINVDNLGRLDLLLVPELSRTARRTRSLNSGAIIDVFTDIATNNCNDVAGDAIMLTRKRAYSIDYRHVHNPNQFLKIFRTG
jgi:hypothetical protein